MEKELSDEEKAKHKYYNWKKHMGNYKQVDNNPVIISQKEFNLSEKMHEINHMDQSARFIYTEDVKEFIKRVEKITGHSPDWEEIKELAGSKLS